VTNWMRCTTCGTTVLANETGTCHACQSGFINPGEDSYQYHQIKERIDAIEERLQQEDDKREHQNGDESGKAKETGCRYLPPNCS